METTWTDLYQCSSYEVDAQGKLALPSLARFLQETAYHHAHHLEFGYEHLKEQNLFWVLSRLRIEVYRYPKWTETLRVRTWPSVIEGLLAFREFQVLDDSDRLLAAAGSAWLMLDWEKRRPQRTTLLQEKLSLFPKHRALPEAPAKLPGLTLPQEGEPFPVRYSDLDLYAHVNNARYVQWIVDGYPEDILNNLEISLFEINFLAESRLGDKIVLQTEFLTENENTLSRLHCVRRLGDQQALSLARILWRKP